MATLFEAYVTNAGKYSEGQLVGETLKFPTTAQEVEALLKRIGVDGVRYQEIFITSFDGDVLGLYDHLSEYENLDELNHLACLLSELTSSELETLEAVLDSGDHCSSVRDIINLTQNLDCYGFYPGVSDEETLGRIYVDDLEMLDVPDQVKPYFDYEAYGRDACIHENGHFAPGGYVVKESDHFVEVYHGLQDIPKEHKVFSFPKLSIREQMAAYHIIWAGILLMLLSVGITLFASTALDGTVWTFPHLVERVIQNNTTTIFPMCITLIAGYIIAREKSDDTLKSIMTIPVSYPALIGGKLIVCGFLSVFLGMASTFFTVAAELLVGFPGFSVTAVIQALIQITLNTLFLYIAVTPIIAFTARIPNGHMIGVILAFVYGYGGMFAAGNMSLANLYPITASMGLIQYRSHDAAVHWNIGLCSLSMIVVLLISVAIVVTTKNVSSAKVVKKPKKTALKKGW